MIDCPKHVIEVRRNEDGTLDEIVASNCWIYLEQMSDGAWWLGIEKAGYRQVVNLHTMRGAKIAAVCEMDDWPKV